MIRFYALNKLSIFLYMNLSSPQLSRVNKSIFMKTNKRISVIMRNLIVIALCLLGTLNGTSAQDIITLKTGEEIKAKVNAVELNVIKYTKFDDQAGPVFKLYKADVFMIKYENGSKDVFDYHEPTPATPPSQNESGIMLEDEVKLTNDKGKVMKDQQILMPYEVKAIMYKNYEALKRYRGARAFNTLGIIFSAIGGIDIGLGLSNTFHNYDATSNFLAGGIEIGIGLVFNSISKNKTQSSVLLYNSGLKNKHSTSLNFGLSGGGLGLCLKF
jgi:hypothetical protein